MSSYWSSSEGLLLGEVGFGFGFEGFDMDVPQEDCASSALIRLLSL